jgi:hypothetical protein
LTPQDKIGETTNRLPPIELVIDYDAVFAG